MLKEFKKFTRKVNKVNAKVKDAEAVVGLMTGDTQKFTRRAKNKTKWRLMNKLMRKI
ncbi:hypothetical protein [Brassicibacter mesophilus]|uniref:hypothetical protein n=1 Tax=Brassicibacter mesophilus TaxID=745119 RepID=UPI003D1B5B20